MNWSKNLEFSTYDSLDTNELEFLKKNSIKLDDALKNQLKTDPDYLFKIEKEIGSYFNRNPSILEAEMVYDYYIRIISFSGLKPKDVHELKLLSKFPAPLKSYVNDKNADLNINQIFLLIEKINWGNGWGSPRQFRILRFGTMEG